MVKLGLGVALVLATSAYAHAQSAGQAFAPNSLLAQTQATAPPPAKKPPPPAPRAERSGGSKHEANTD